jgi:hypothetical protein
MACVMDPIASGISSSPGSGFDRSTRLARTDRKSTA